MAKDVEIRAEKAISSTWQESAENSMQLYQKEKRKKWSVGVSGGYSVVSAGGEVRTGQRFMWVYTGRFGNFKDT